MSNQFSRKVLFVLVVVTLLLGSFIAGRLLNKPENVLAQEITENGVRWVSHYCYLNSVAVYDVRIHVRCTLSDDGISYFAIETTRENEMLINRVMAIALTEMSMDRPVYVYYDPISSNNPPGCNTGDCRKLIAISGIK